MCDKGSRTLLIEQQCHEALLQLSISLQVAVQGQGVELIPQQVQGFYSAFWSAGSKALEKLLLLQLEKQSLVLQDSCIPLSANDTH